MELSSSQISVIFKIDQLQKIRVNISAAAKYLFNSFNWTFSCKAGKRSSFLSSTIAALIIRMYFKLLHMFIKIFRHHRILLKKSFKDTCFRVCFSLILRGFQRTREMYHTVYNKERKW